VTLIRPRAAAVATAVALGATLISGPSAQPIANANPPAEGGQPPHGKAWARHTVDDTLTGADGIRLADINHDGLPDITTGWEQGGRVRTYLHPVVGAVKDRWPLVDVGAAASAEDAFSADIDGDGALDVVSSTEGSERSVYVYWAPSEGTAWQRDRLPAPAYRWMFAVPANLDGKNGLDLVVGAKDANAEVALLLAPADPRDIDGWQYVPLGRVGWTMTLDVLDIDEDGDQDVLLADRRKTQPDNQDLRGLRWLENPGASSAAFTSPWVSRTIARQGTETMFSGRGDFDGDGDLDFIVPDKIPSPDGNGNAGQLHWIENRWDGTDKPSLEAGDFVEHRLPWPGGVGGAKAAAFGDIDGDGTDDVVLTFEGARDGLNGLVWLRHRGKERWQVRTLSGSDGIKHDDATLADLDADGDLDVLTTEEQLEREGIPTGLGVIWYENPTR
jgi:hypothetical protein